MRAVVPDNALTLEEREEEVEEAEKPGDVETGLESMINNTAGKGKRYRRTTGTQIKL